MHKNLLDRAEAALMIVDIQEAFRGVIHGYENLIARSVIAVKGFQTLERPIFVTEQYPRGLGATVAEITGLLSDTDLPFEKTAFSGCGADGLVEMLRSSGVKQIAVCGIEAHICVNQTVHDLLDMGFSVHVLTDAISSRREADREAGIEKMIASGAVRSTVEMALFELMSDARHEQFRDLQVLVK